MDKLLSFAYDNLKTHGYKVYRTRPMESVAYPFIQFDVGIVLRNVNPLLATLTIDIWDRNFSDENIEELANDVDDGLENLSYGDESIQVKVKRQSRQKVEDIDIGIQRRQLTYQLRVFYKE